MSMIDRSLDGMASLSGQLGAILKRRLREVGGIALISLAMMAALALATWSVQDPSLSHATDARVHNLLGITGAVAADLMMQLLGLGSLALLLPIAVWGYRLLGHRRLNRERLRVLLWLIGAVLAAAFASCLPRSSSWPLPSGLGGVIGDAMLRLPVMLFHIQLVGVNRLVAASALGLLAVVTLAGAAGALWRDAPEEDEAEEEQPAEDDEDDERLGFARLPGAYDPEFPGADCAAVPPPRTHPDAGARRAGTGAAPHRAALRQCGRALRRRGRCGRRRRGRAARSAQAARAPKRRAARPAAIFFRRSNF